MGAEQFDRRIRGKKIPILIAYNRNNLDIEIKQNFGQKYFYDKHKTLIT